MWSLPATLSPALFTYAVRSGVTVCSSAEALLLVTNGLQAVRLMATHIPPQVFLQNAGSELQLVYGTNYTGYTVESSSNLSDWSTFSTGTNVVELSPTNASQFFRLSKP